jgi:hypothetical protein
VNVNILFLDPYYEITLISMFKSTFAYQFPEKDKRYQDQIIASFLYSDKSQPTDIVYKCLTQFPDFFDVRDQNKDKTRTEKKEADEEKEEKSEEESDDE